MNKKYLDLTFFYTAILIAFGALFLTGTFCDETIAAFLYSPDNICMEVVTSIGIYPFFAFLVLLFGSLFERALHSQHGRKAKAALCFLCVLLSAIAGIIGTDVFLGKDCFGVIFPSLKGNFTAISAVCIVGVYPLFFLGYKLACGTKDKLLAKRIVGLIVIMLLALVTMLLLKDVFHRPRYRTVVLGYEGIGFFPWYTPFKGASAYIKNFGIDKGEFRSFPSGHSILSISLIYIIQSLTWFFPKLKKKAVVMSFAALLFGAVIMFTRMVLGAHFLSDVSAAAMIGTMFSLVHTLIQRRITAGEDSTADGEEPDKEKALTTA